MDTTIRNLVFDAAGDNTQYGIHRCPASDGNSQCSFGTTSWSVSAHKNYFGKSVSGFGRDGCPNPACLDELRTLEAQINEMRASIAILERSIQSTPVQSDKIAIGIRMVQRQATLDTLQNRLEALPCYIRTSNNGRSVGDSSNPDDGNA